MITEKQFYKKYREVKEHRKVCAKWGKSFCLDCFGGGLCSFCGV
jgi:hypothetical protein